MKNHICDLCGKSVSNLIDLKPEYQTENLREICDSCDVKAFKYCTRIANIWEKLKTTMVIQWLKANKK